MEGLFDTIGGLPVHVLVVHAVIVLVPLSALVAFVVAFSDTWRRRLAVPLVLLVTAATGSAFVAAQSGESLSERVRATPTLARHEQLGDASQFWIGGFWLVTVLWYWLQRDAREEAGQSVNPWWSRILMLIGAVAATGAVVVAGHLGSESVWSSVVSGG